MAEARCYPRHVNFTNGTYISVKNAEEEAKAKLLPGWFEFPDCPPKTETMNTNAQSQPATVYIDASPKVVVKEIPKVEEKKKPGRPKGK
jgi:hypothetical protein